MIVLMMVKRFVPSTEPLGYIPRVGEAKFEVANPSRSRLGVYLTKIPTMNPLGNVNIVSLTSMIEKSVKQ